ncbi:DJ-1/PfpI family protein [Paenibacillus donghaensis]|uniref:Thiamine biosynthesis protein ThiJ n=1 Tax=Paenibacillus donghaensis TaxID=414771 RepID=A0A2Z2KD23_9BACL|nr:DJ-1/PfpI family protein [Paenibacillus donghaensis]ASA20863.1 thiamine biosynthesis protein ThiJ [Paenibacillus donghaensis]
MKIACILFDGITFLDFAGFYDVVNRLGNYTPDRELILDICAARAEVTDELGLTVKAGKVLPDLASYDLVFVPGGMGTRRLRYDEAFVAWLRSARHVPYLVSVCTGSLLLGAAGFLEGKAATTHPAAYDLLAPYCRQVEKARIVQDGTLITAGGVATSIDLGLYVIALLAGDAAKREVMKQIDYPYELQGVICV